MARATTTATPVRRASARTSSSAKSEIDAEQQAASPSAPNKSKRKAADPTSAADPKQNGTDATAEASDAATAAPTKKPRKKAVADSDSPSAPRSEDTLADPSLPKNTEMPSTLSYARPAAPESIRITAWNITSLKSSEPKGMMRYIQAEDAHIVVLSETKVNDVPMHPALSKIYKHQYWGIGKQKGYAGLAILSKIEPIKATYGLPGLKDQDTKGRIITLEFENTFLVGTYAVNAGDGLKVEICCAARTSKSCPHNLSWRALILGACNARGPDMAATSSVAPLFAVSSLARLRAQPQTARLTFSCRLGCSRAIKTMATKQAWNTAFAAYLAELDAKKPVVWCGDFNVVQDERDLAAASKKWNKSPGYTAIECDAHRALLDGSATPSSQPLVDVWRAKHPDAVGHYTFYGWRGFCRSKGIGWRLDSFILSQRIVEKALECEIRHECYGASDHVPIYCDIQGPL